MLPASCLIPPETCIHAGAGNHLSGAATNLVVVLPDQKHGRASESRSAYASRVALRVLVNGDSL